MKIVASYPRGCRVAVLGAGTCNLPRLLPACYTVDIYELEPAIVKWAHETFKRPSHWTFIVGDWHKTITGTYDVIVLDTGEPGCEQELRPHLNEGGLLLGV